MNEKEIGLFSLLGGLTLVAVGFFDNDKFGMFYYANDMQYAVLSTFGLILLIIGAYYLTKKKGRTI